MSSTDWTKDEKYAVIKVLADIAAADGTVDMEETKLIYQTRIALGISQTEYLKIGKMPVIESLIILSDMEEEKRIQMANTMKELILADGEVHEKEMQMFQTALKFMGIGMA